MSLWEMGLPTAGSVDDEAAASLLSSWPASLLGSPGWCWPSALCSPSDLFCSSTCFSASTIDGVIDRSTMMA
jgi:hypothetical protein